MLMVISRSVTPAFKSESMTAESELIVGPESVSNSSSTVSPKRKPAPVFGKGKGKLPLKFEYSPSEDGIDENLLIMLHGLGRLGDNMNRLHRQKADTVWVYTTGDTEKPFANLGRQLRLPQTAVLSLRAPGK